MNVVLAKGQERGRLAPSLFRLSETVENPSQAVKSLLIRNLQALRLLYEVVCPRTAAPMPQIWCRP
jgi:hypothetical protein